jgi:hypothetical protein
MDRDAKRARPERGQSAPKKKIKRESSHSFLLSQDKDKEKDAGADLIKLNLGDKDEEMEEINKEADEVIKRIRGGAVKV